MVGDDGFEPSTPSLSVTCSNRAELIAHADIILTNLGLIFKIGWLGACDYKPPLAAFALDGHRLESRPGQFDDRQRFCSGYIHPNCPEPSATLLDDSSSSTSPIVVFPAVTTSRLRQLDMASRQEVFPPLVEEAHFRHLNLRNPRADRYFTRKMMCFQGEN
jgi:hypothetical protein